MQERLDRINNHIRKHKVAYAVGLSLGVGVAAGIVGTRILMKPSFVSVAPVQKVGFAYKSPLTQTIEVYVEALGDPGNIIQDLKTGTIYASQGQAAKALDVSPSTVSKHLAGLTDYANGHKLVKLGKAFVPEVA